MRILFVFILLYVYVFNSMIFYSEYQNNLYHFRMTIKSIVKSKCVYINVIYYVIITILTVIMAIFHAKTLIYGVIYMLMCFLYTLIIKANMIHFDIVFTRKMSRLFIINLAVYLCFILPSFFIYNSYYLIYFMFACYIVLQWIFIAMSLAINYPIDKYIESKYIKLAKDKLLCLPNLKIIAITGTYGKTSVKEILYTLLSVKYNVVKSPGNYNTTFGITKTILEYVKNDTDILILEMGANVVGDIKKLCEIAHPHYGILVSIGLQHLASFGSIENIIKTKSELSDYIDKNNGIMVFNYANDYIKNIADSYKGEKVLCGDVDASQSLCYAKNILCDINGTTFDFVLDHEAVTNIHVPVLGSKSVENIVCAISMAHVVGLNLEDIKIGLKNIKIVGARLEKIMLPKGAILINNGYNSNIDSCQMSFEVLSYNVDKIKVVVTPGLIELGHMQYDINYKFGERIARVADRVAIIKQENRQAILDGLLSLDFDKEHIMYFDTYMECYEKYIKNLDSNYVVLVENDLPKYYK